MLTNLKFQINKQHNEEEAMESRVRKILSIHIGLELKIGL